MDLDTAKRLRDGIILLHQGRRADIPAGDRELVLRATWRDLEAAGELLAAEVMRLTAERN
jgi:hypothetical protein